MKSFAKRQISWRNSFHECSKRCTRSPGFRVTMSDMVGGWFGDMTGADDKMAGGPAERETIEEMDKDLTKVIEDFGRAVEVEALHLAQKSSKRSFLNGMILHFNGVV